MAAVEAVDAAGTGYLGGLNFGGASYKDWGFMTLISWPVGGLLAAGVAWLIGKTALGLRSDYLAIATLGISEIIIAVMKNEDWLSRGVKNVIGLPRPVPYEIELQESAGFIEHTTALGLDPVTSSSIVVKLGYAGLFSIVLVIVLILAQLALASPWGRMMRAIRDNEEAAEAMGKKCHSAAFANFHPWLGHLRRGRRPDDHARQPVDPLLLPAAALHLFGVGDGDCGRFRQ